MSAEMNVIDLPLSSIAMSPNNVRQTCDHEAFTELTESIKEHGVLQPIICRPLETDRFEIVCGARRFLAASELLLPTIPAIVRVFSDPEALATQIVENLQRADPHPLDEADGYVRMESWGYSVARISERVGRSVNYIYDRMKLAALTDLAKAAFLSDMITSGHAILLARLKPEVQNRLIGTRKTPGDQFDGEIWIPQEGLPFDERASAFKAISVRELAAWIDKHVRFAKDSVDPMLFPETAATLECVPNFGKVIPITYEMHVPPEARDGRTWHPQSWKRADGRDGSKACDHSALGVVVAGRKRWDAFQVCAAREKCKTHWAKEMNAKEDQKLAKARGRTATNAEARARLKHENARARREKEAIALDAAIPAILSAFKESILDAAPTTTGPLAKIIRDELGMRVKPRGFETLTAERCVDDFMRNLAWDIAYDTTVDSYGLASIAAVAATLGVDLKPLLASGRKASPKPPKSASTQEVQTSAQPKKAARPSKRSKVSTAAKDGTCRECGCADKARAVESEWPEPTLCDSCGDGP